MKKASLDDLEGNPLFDKSKDDIWPITKFELKRNIARFPFPNKMTKKERDQVLRLIADALDQIPSFSQAKLIPAEDLSPIDKQKLYEQFLITTDICDSKPGIGFILLSEKNLLISINTTDHVHIQKIDTTCDWQGSFEEIMQIDAALNKSLNFSYNETFGFLTTDPKDCGTGLKIYAFLHLPSMLSNQDKQELLESINASSEIVSIDDENTHLGNIAIVKNRYSVGVSEDQIFSTTHASAMQLHHLEKQKRLSLTDSTKFKDKVSRAYGLLKHSYEISPKEAILALSDLLLGVHYEWIEGIDPKEIGKLFFEMRRAHFQALGSKEPKEEEISHKRASLIHEKLKNVNLNI